MDYQESADLVVKALFNALDDLTRGQMEAWPKMFATDGILQFPFAPEGYPDEVVGSGAIAAYLADYPETFAISVIHRDGIYSSENGLVVEFHVEGHGVKTGAPYNQRYVGIIQHAEGKILRYRDYWNPLIAFAATGGLDALHEFGTKPGAALAADK